MKKFFFVIIIFSFLIIIYYLYTDKKVYVLYINDNNNDYSFNEEIVDFFSSKELLEKNVVFNLKSDYRIVDLTNNINDNIAFEYDNIKYNVDNCLIKADIIFLSIGFNDLNYNINYDYIDEVMEDFNKLFKLLRKYSKERIVFFNYYYFFDDDIMKYINKKIQVLSLKYNIDVIKFNNKYFDDSIRLSNYLNKLY